MNLASLEYDTDFLERWYIDDLVGAVYVYSLELSKDNESKFAKTT